MSLQEVQQIALGRSHRTALLHWRIRRQDGSELQSFHTHYHLMRGPQGPKVLLCTAYQEDISEIKNHAAQ